MVEADVLEIMEHFKYTHLPEAQQAISKPFCELALWMVQTLPSNTERYFALRDLLHAKDSAERSIRPRQ